jgi:alpha-L-glutamate ligase-like protein
MGIFNQGILGLNARNLLYLSPYNRDKSIEIADNKLKAKAFLSAREIPVPKLMGSITNKEELYKFNFNKLGNEFVVKPNYGYGGQGIIPISGKVDQHFIGPRERLYSRDDLIEHIKDILQGQFSLSERPDTAFFEKLIISDDIIGKYSYGGLPDIRIIVHNLVPVMAMLRLPTKESEGKANLHQGAIGAGIDLAKGEITHLLQKGKIIDQLPGGGNLKGVKIPFWDDVLRIACKCQLASNLGYMGADIAIDRQQGPVLLEINARAGIGIQLANMAPLRKRLEKLEGLEVKTIEKGVRMAKDMFGYSIEKNIKSISGKQVIGIYENLEFLNKKTSLSAIAFINTSRRKSYLGIDIAKKLDLIKSKKQKNLDFLRFKLKFKIGGKKITSIFKIDKNIKKKYQVILGNRDIGGQFLIDTSINNLLTENKSGTAKKIFIINYDPLETDRQICKIISQLKFLSYFRPINFLEESNRFITDHSYNPQFRYKEAEQEIGMLKKELGRIRFDDSELGLLFSSKITELNQLLELIRMRGSEDFTALSSQIFGSPSASDLEEIKNYSKPHILKKYRKLNSLQLKEIFEETLASYDLNDWRVILKKNLLTRCVVNRNKKILIKNNSTFNELRVKELIIHEIETHLLTGENGSRQKFRLFNFGFANYLETQEGLAMYNIVEHGNMLGEERHKNVLTESIYNAQKMSFAELFDSIKAKNISNRSAMDICFRLKRGLSDTSLPGAFTKDYCYYRGKKKIIKYLQEGGQLADLYHGKYSVDDIAAIKHISNFKTPPILPSWLR